MECDREALSGLVDGELDATAREALEHHLSQCASCRAEREAMVGLGRDLALLEAPLPSERAVAAAVGTARRAVARRDRSGQDAPSAWAWIVGAVNARVSVPLPALALGLALLLIALVRPGGPVPPEAGAVARAAASRAEPPARQRPMSPSPWGAAGSSAELAVYEEEWSDQRALWGDHPPPAHADGAIGVTHRGPWDPAQGPASPGDPAGHAEAGGPGPVVVLYEETFDI